MTDNSSQDDKMAQFRLFDPSLPEEVRSTGIHPDFSLKGYGLFAQTSQAAEEAVAFLRLLPSAVDVEPESYKQEDETKLAAIAILKRHPELLFKKGMVIDQYGRKIWASPYQAFWGTGDTWALKQIHEEILPSIKDGEIEAKIQFKKQFPDCKLALDPNTGEEVLPPMTEESLYDDRNREQIEQVIAQLQIIVAGRNRHPDKKIMLPLATPPAELNLNADGFLQAHF